MMTNSFSTQNLFYAVAQPSRWTTAFFVSGTYRSWVCCFLGIHQHGRRNFTAMRDQNFQELMSKFGNRNLLDDGPGSVSETLPYHTVGEAKPSIEEQLDSQLAFKQFLKRSIPNIKPSSEFIQSILSALAVSLIVRDGLLGNAWQDCRLCSGSGRGWPSWVFGIC